MSTTPSHQNMQPSRVPSPQSSRSTPQGVMERADILPYVLPSNLIRSGHITRFGIILRVDRCAPEHGGGILAMVAGNKQIVITDESCEVYGIVDFAHLDRLRRIESAVTGIDYSAGVR